MRAEVNAAGRVTCLCCLLVAAGAVGCKTEAPLVPSSSAGTAVQPGTAGQSAAAGHGAAAEQSAPAGQGGSVAGSDAHQMQAPVDPGTPVSVALSKLQGQQASALMASTEKARSVTAEQLRASRVRKHITQLGYDPMTAQGFDLIQKSGLGLSDAEQKAFKERGFVVGRHTFPTMIEGYAAIYMFDLPLYVSADSILDSVYRSYDSILRDVEEGGLITALGDLLDGMRATLGKDYKAHRRAPDADFYLAVAKSLLSGTPAPPVAGAKSADITALTNAAKAATGHDERVLFGSTRDVDFSQFKPRGHYTKSEALERYFRAMMWLGRIELRVIETKSSGEQVFHRGAFEASVLLRKLAAANDENFNRIDKTIEAFVGTSDYMRLPEIDALLGDLGVTFETLSTVDDQRVAATILEKGYGAQQIASQIIENATPDNSTLPLDRSFALFGQRYTVDSHVFSNVVYDRVKDRLMPNPLDVAYAALGNDTAAGLLGSDLPSYAGALESMRVLVDAHDAEFWNENLYNLWTKALRALSPTPDGDKVHDKGMPMVTGTAAWDSRILNTQLASWSQLRHNTVLYAKQSVTGTPSCAFPDAYVDPYPEFYRALGEFAAHGQKLTEVLAGLRSVAFNTRVRAYFDNLASAMTVLGGMAQAQREGKAFTADQLVFINQAVVNAGALYVCAGPPTFNGWFAKLDYEVENGRVPSVMKPSIVDVHTQPADAGGNDVGRILHVGTGLPRVMVVSVDTCEGARAYAGLAASYHEVITDGWQRMTDEDWAPIAQGKNGVLPADVPWASSFTAP